MKKLSQGIIAIFMLCSLCTVAQQVNPLSLKEREGWVINTVATGYMWYNYTGYYAPFASNQTVNVIEIDLNLHRYAMEIVHTESPDSLSAFVARSGAVGAINGSYFEPDVSYVKTSGRVWREVTLSADHVRFWKHEGALYLDTKSGKVSIEYGDNTKYRNSTCSDILSGAPMLIDNYKGVGVQFVGNIDSLDLTKLDYEDYRRHQGVRHPRVAVALTGDNKLLLITVDGRWPSSVGMSAKELTLFLQRFFNPQSALNLDGGGSTTMCVRGHGVYPTHVVNFPTDNKLYDHYGQRKVNNVILIKNLNDSSCLKR